MDWDRWAGRKKDRRRGQEDRRRGQEARAGGQEGRRTGGKEGKRTGGWSPMVCRVNEKIEEEYRKEREAQTSPSKSKKPARH